jgi:hypothetical protein
VREGDSVLVTIHYVRDPTMYNTVFGRKFVVFSLHILLVNTSNQWVYLRRNITMNY